MAGGRLEVGSWKRFALLLLLCFCYIFELIYGGGLFASKKEG
jgi:hypothetical protein